MHITTQEMSHLPFQFFRKVASFQVRARRLTKEDVEQRAGMIHTMEGPVACQPGDYLVRGIQGEEYPIRPEAFAVLYDEGSREPDPDGFARYRPAPLHHYAVQIMQPFTVVGPQGDLFAGKAGDYLIRTEGVAGVRICDRSIFEQVYERVGGL